MDSKIDRIIVFGGSAGSVKVVFNLLKALPKDYAHPIVMALHRPAEKKSNMGSLFKEISKLPFIEPQKQMSINKGTIYLAPSGVHILIESTQHISIDESPLVQYSRPSIDVLFHSAAEIFTDKVVGVLVTGSNEDGAQGMKSIVQNGGISIVQDPKEAVIPRMPQSAINIAPIKHILPASEIIDFIVQLK